LLKNVLVVDTWWILSKMTKTLIIKYKDIHTVFNYVTHKGNGKKCNRLLILRKRFRSLVIWNNNIIIILLLHTNNY